MLRRICLNNGICHGGRRSIIPRTLQSMNYSVNGQQREVMETDVLIVGGGPAGLAAAIRLGQLGKQFDTPLNVMLIEKGAEIGSHILSGAVIEPRAINELFPEWQKEYGPESADPIPLNTSVTKDKMYLLTKSSSISLPLLPQMHNQGNYITSLSQLTRWLGRRAEELNISLFPGFAGRSLLINDVDGLVEGVITNDVGVDREGRGKEGRFEAGMAIKAKITLFAEGCHGSLTKDLIKKFNLRSNSQHQTYGLGLKEVWEVSPEKHQKGLVMHGVGWPLDRQTYGGSFMYHYGDNLVAVGLVVGLDYQNPFINPYLTFQQLKLHPIFKNVLGEGAKCIAYGARALNEGGIQSIPKLHFPGGLLIGCTAGFLNVPKIKGSHTAMKSGMIAAEQVYRALTVDNVLWKDKPLDLVDYETELRNSWVWDELWKVRNVRPSFHHFGLYGGMLWSGIDQLIFRGKLPFTIMHGPPDHATLKKAEKYKPINYPKPDGKLTFDLMTNVSRTGTNHEEDQPIHLQLNNPSIQPSTNYPIYAGPEQRFCPAGVYEYLRQEEDSGSSVGDVESVKFQINAQNCIHCKTCDIKDPSQNINWVPPEGGGGPKYTMT